MTAGPHRRVTESARAAAPLVAAGLLVAATLWLRAPTWNDRILFIDEAIGVTYGQRLQLPGASVYTHTPDMKPPLGPLTYLAAVTLSGEHAIAVVHVFTTVTLAVTALLLLSSAVYFAGSVGAGAAAGLLYLLAAGGFSGREPLLAFSSYDHFMAPWLLAFAYAFLVALQRQRFALAVAAGAALGVAGLYKQNAPVLVAAAWAVAMVAVAQGRLTARRAAALAGAVTVATAAVVAAPPLYYAARGQFAEWWFFNVEGLRRYSGFASGLNWPARAGALLAALPMPALAGPACVYGLLGAVRRDRTNWTGLWTLLATLCGVVVLASLVPGQAKAHYVLQALPFECALIGLLPAEVWRGRRAAAGGRRIVAAAAGIALAVAVGLAARNLYGARAVLLQYIADDRYLGVHRRAGTLDAVVGYVRAHSTADDLIYVQGTAPEFYFLTQRRPAASDAFQGWFVWPWNDEAGARLLRELQATPPRLIVQLGYGRYYGSWYLDVLPGFCSWMHANYREHVVTDLAQVLERVDSADAKSPTGPVAPLGELQPTGCAQTAWMRLDRSAAGAPLSVAGTIHASGLGVRAPSAIAYAVPAGYATFAAAVGVDDRSGAGDAVRFRVEVDNAVRFERVARRGDPPQTIAVDVAGAGTLRLIADSEPGDPRRSNDADWLDARFLRAAPAGGAH